MFSVMKLTEIVLALRNRDTVLQTIKCKKKKRFCLEASDLRFLSFIQRELIELPWLRRS